jgi:general stress protein CsbA
MFPCVLTLTHGSMTCSQWCSHVFSPSHMVQWCVPNDVRMCSHPHTWFNDMFPMMFPFVLILTHGSMTCSQWCSPICASCGFLNFSNILYHFFLTPYVVPLIPMCSHPNKCFKNFSHDIGFAIQEVGKQTRSKEWGLCAGYRGIWAERERERERGLQRIHSENKQVLGWSSCW